MHFPGHVHETPFLQVSDGVSSSEQDKLSSRPSSIEDISERQRQRHVASSRPSDPHNSPSPYPARTSHSTRPDQPSHSLNLGSFYTSARAPIPERQWTLFGQVMVNEQRGSYPRRNTRVPSEFLSQEGLGGNFPPTTVFDGGASGAQSPAQEHPAAADASDDITISTDNDSDDCEDSDDSGVARSSHQQEETSRWYSPKSIPLPTITNVHRNVFKCVVAYFIASLFTFSPIFASWISDITTDNEPGKSSPSPSGHMVATV